MQDLLRKIETGELQLGQPWKPTNKSLTLVIPIIIKTAGKRSYVVLEEIKDKVKIVDTGHIGEIRITADHDKPIFIRGGTMLKGATQERANPYSIIIAPQIPEEIMVHCIHATRGIMLGAILTPSGHAPRQVYAQMLLARDQSLTWNAVTQYSNSILPEIGADSLLRGDDLVGTYENIKNFRKELEEPLKQIPDHINQVGVVIVDSDGIVGLELYDHPDSWKAFSESILRSFSEAIAREDKTGIFTVNEDAVLPTVQAFLKEIASAQQEEVFNKNNARTTIIKTKNYVGEYTKLDESTIHLSITRREKEVLMGQPIQQIIRPYWPRRREITYPDQLPRDDVYPPPFYFASASEFPPLPPQKLNPLLNLLNEPRTWTELKKQVPIAKATLSTRMKTLQNMGLVEKVEAINGTTKYTLTGTGQELARRKKKNK